MSGVMGGRWTAQSEEEFVVFLIGMRINRWWMVHRWLPLIWAMSGMIRELTLNPELGFVGGKTWFGRTIMLVQYWRSFDQLEAYAHARGLRHLPAWTEFNRRIANNETVGVFHESYRVAPGQFENVFVNMPPTLLGRCATLVEARGKLARARGRMESDMPVQPVGRASGCQPVALEELVRLVGQALEMSDELGHSLAGIHLCSALERLRESEMRESQSTKERRVV